MRAGTSSGEIWIWFQQLAFSFQQLACLLFSMRLLVFLLSISIYRVFWNSLLSVDGGPLYVGRAEHEGGLFPGKVKSVFFHIFYSKGSVVLSSLVLSPVPIPVFVFTRLCSKIPCHILHTWMFYHKFHTKMCHQIKHPKELLITCYTKGQPRP